ncbi:hypothetical protein KKC88_00170 [Patescibacteria group bacterium]|nr:hypothetical protein [Patescibacteria group bacterium]MBU1673046.1 hypothetical protein [Patescibacteria group bacterium]
MKKENMTSWEALKQIEQTVDQFSGYYDNHFDGDIVFLISEIRGIINQLKTWDGEKV